MTENAKLKPSEGLRGLAVRSVSIPRFSVARPMEMRKSGQVFLEEAVSLRDYSDWCGPRVERARSAFRSSCWE